MSNFFRKMNFCCIKNQVRSHSFQLRVDAKTPSKHFAHRVNTKSCPNQGRIAATENGARLVKLLTHRCHKSHALAPQKGGCARGRAMARRQYQWLHGGHSPSKSMNTRPTPLANALAHIFFKNSKPYTGMSLSAHASPQPMPHPIANAPTMHAATEARTLRKL